MAQSDKIKIRFHFGTRWVGANTEDVVEYDRDEWDSMTEDEKDAAAMEFASDAGLDVGWNEED